jgi:hypothetical protein
MVLRCHCRASLSAAALPHRGGAVLLPALLALRWVPLVVPLAGDVAGDASSRAGIGERRCPGVVSVSGVFVPCRTNISISAHRRNARRRTVHAAARRIATADLHRVRPWHAL